MYCWIRIASFLISLHGIIVPTVIGTRIEDVIQLGGGRCQRQWTVPERVAEYYTVREQCKYYESCYYKTVTKSRTKVVDKPMHVDFCCEGYVNRGSIYELDCKPTCEPMCVNGECTAPGNCTCNEGYGMSPSSNHICEHKCVPECVNATCVGVNECDCYAGFDKNNSDPPHMCRPHCTFGCVHGDCTAPEICSCHEGYTLSSNHSVCLPVCDLECINGFCSGPNTCTCFGGYKEDYGWQICTPICSEPCMNGECTSPDNCTCWGGYVKTSNHTCEPHCSRECRNGECISPETCICKERYEMDDNDTCIPICSLGCENGTCVSPDNCLCDDRHYYSNGACLPWCADGCTNGVCTGPTECSCHEGTFTLSPSYCAPSCSSVGTCIDYSSSIDANGNSTTLNLIGMPSIRPAKENRSLCDQIFSHSCCSVGLNYTQGDSLVVICTPKDNHECEDHDMNVPSYLWTRQYEERNDTNMTGVVLVLVIIDHDGETNTTHFTHSPCYSQLCPGPAFRFLSGETRIFFSIDSETDDMKLDEPKQDYLEVTVIVCTLSVLIALIVLAGIFYYIKRVRKISYEVNASSAGESAAQLCGDNEVTLEDEL